MKAILLNCTLKRSPAISSTEVLLSKILDGLHRRRVEGEIIRIADYDVRFGVQSDMGAGDEWPQILPRILAAEILVVGTPIWMANRGSICQLVFERLDALLNETNPAGQLPLYNKVGAAVTVGNEDGAQTSNASILYNLMQLGCTIPPNAEAYWVGQAGGSDDYVDVGQASEYTNKLIEYTASNLVHLATMLQEHPIPKDGNLNN